MLLMHYVRAETNTKDNQVLIKDFSARIVKLVLKYSVSSCDPMFISSHDAFELKQFACQEHLPGSLTWHMYIVCYLKVTYVC